MAGEAKGPAVLRPVPASFDQGDDVVNIPSGGDRVGVHPPPDSPDLKLQPGLHALPGSMQLAGLNAANRAGAMVSGLDVLAHLLGPGPNLEGVHAFIAAPGLPAALNEGPALATPAPSVFVRLLVVRKGCDVAAMVDHGSIVLIVWGTRHV